MDGGWLLLIYTLPAKPSRLRATVWRDLKATGALYLRDGVATLPDRPSTRASLTRIAARATDLGGSAVLATGAALSAEDDRQLRARFGEALDAEYADLAWECGEFRDRLRRETDHYDLRRSERSALLASLARLRRRASGLRARDYFGSLAGQDVEDALGECGRILGESEDAPAADNEATMAEISGGHSCAG
jgi:hypothetical protein